jgi:hypothetical protein
MAQLVEQARELIDVVKPSRANGHRAHLGRKYERASKRGREACSGRRGIIHAMAGGEGLRGAAARRAGVDDAPALVRLRAVMFDAIDLPVGDKNADWRLAAEAWFRDQLDHPTIFAAFVVDDASSGVVSAACGICDARAPGPRGLSGVRGRVPQGVR